MFNQFGMDEIIQSVHTSWQDHKNTRKRNNRIVFELRHPHNQHEHHLACHWGTAIDHHHNPHHHRDDEENSGGARAKSKQCLRPCLCVKPTDLTSEHCHHEDEERREEDDGELDIIGATISSPCQTFQLLVFWAFMPLMGRILFGEKSMRTGAESRNIPSMVPSNRRGLFMCVLTPLLENVFTHVALEKILLFHSTCGLWMVAWLVIPSMVGSNRRGITGY